MSEIRVAQVSRKPLPFGRRIRFYAAVLAAERRAKAGVEAIKAKR